MADCSENMSAESADINFFDFLPTEIVTLVLTQPSLYFRDVVNFGTTCKRYLGIISDNELWKVKLLYRFPCLQQVADSMKPTSAWLDHCRQLHKLPETVKSLVAGLSAKCFLRDEVTYSHFRPLKELYYRSDLCQALMDEVLMTLVNDEDKYKDLTLRYYAEKTLRYLCRTKLRQEWQALLALPIEQQNLLEGAILFERWHSFFSPSPKDSIRQEVSQIAERARRKLKMDHPSYHSNIGGAVEMTPEQCYEVFDAVNEVMFKEMNFQGNSEDFYNESNSYMSLVLTTKLAIPITLCILYEAVVRKLGITLRPVNFPGHFVLCWNYSSDGFKESDTNLFIDAFKKGRMMTSAEVLMSSLHIGMHGYRPDYLQACQPRAVFQRMAANVMHLRQDIGSNFDGIELQALLNPEDCETVMDCIKYYVGRNINYAESLAMLQEIRPQNNQEQRNVTVFTEMIQRTMEKYGKDDAEPTMPSAKQREDNKEVIYAVGMVMKHRRYNYSCVIYGWDPVCKLSRDWQRHMGVHHLPKQEKQPFYNVLVEDCSNRYAAQGSIDIRQKFPQSIDIARGAMQCMQSKTDKGILRNLSPFAENLDFIDVPVTISHPEVGKYFQNFTGKCYLPNDELACQYPNDMAVTTQKTTEIYAE